MLKKIIAIAAASLALIAHAAVDVNTASVADLDSVKGIGPGTSAQIIEARNSAKFKDWADFTGRVKGIGDKRAVILRNHGVVTVDLDKTGEFSVGNRIIINGRVR